MFNKLKKISLCACLALCTSLTHASSLNDDAQQQGDLSEERITAIVQSSEHNMRQEMKRQKDVEKKISHLRYTDYDEANKLSREEEERKGFFRKEKKENFENVLKKMKEQQVKDIADFFHYVLSDIEFEAEKKLTEQRKQQHKLRIFLDICSKSNQVLTATLLKQGLDLGEPDLLESVLYLPECCGFSVGEGTHRWTEAGKKFDPMRGFDSDSDSDSDNNDHINHNNNNNNNNNNERACAISAMIPQEDPLNNRVCFAFLGNVLKPGMTFELTYTTNGDPANEGPVNFYLGGNFFKQIEPTFKEENLENFHLSFQVPEDMFPHQLMTVGFEVPKPSIARETVKNESGDIIEQGDQRMIGFALKTLKISRVFT